MPCENSTQTGVEYPSNAYSTRAKLRRQSAVGAEGQHSVPSNTLTTQPSASDEFGYSTRVLATAGWGIGGGRQVVGGGLTLYRNTHEQYLHSTTQSRPRGTALDNLTLWICVEKPERGTSQLCRSNPTTTTPHTQGASGYNACAASGTTVPWATSLATLGGGSTAVAVAKPLRSRAGAGALLDELLALNAPLDAPEPIVVRLRGPVDSCSKNGRLKLSGYR